MRRFVFGTEEQFAALDRDLQRGLCYRYPNCVLPSGCSPQKATLAFGMQSGYYVIMIDRGISSGTENQDFRTFLSNGMVRFASLDEMKEFLRSLRPLYQNAQDEGTVRKPHPAGLTPLRPTVPELVRPEEETGETAPAPVEPEGTETVDKDRLHRILDDQNRPKKITPEMIAEPLKKKIFGQDEAIDELSFMAAIKLMQERRGGRPKLLAVGILGPTATGKSETAKTMAEVLTEATGIEWGYIDIAGSEIQQDFAVQSFFGAPPGYVGYGKETKLEPVRKNPYQVIIIDEIEKATTKLVEGLMEAIDTGSLGMADNSKPIDLNHCIMLFTSNLKIDMEEYEAADRFGKNELCRDVFTKFCGRPEISSKIGNFIAFRPLSVDARADIVTKFVREELGTYDLKLGHIDEMLMADFLKHESRYGARDIRLRVRDTVGRWLVTHDIPEDSPSRRVLLKGTCRRMEVEFEDRPASGTGNMPRLDIIQAEGAAEK